MEYLLRHKAFVNAQNDFQETALNYATSLEHLACVKILVQAGASMYIENYSGDFPLEMAANFKNPNSRRILRFFIRSGADVNRGNKHGHTALMSAVLSNRLDSMKILLKAGAHVDQRKKYGKTALMLASEYDKIKAAKILLAGGADVNAFMNDKKDWDYGKTPLMFAAESFHNKTSELLELLLNSGANINGIDTFEQTALIRAAKSKKILLIPILLKHGADPAHKDNQGLTALDHARQMNHADIIKILAKKR